MPGIVLEDLFRSHVANGGSDARMHEVDDIGPPNEVHQRNNHQPHQQGAAADNEGIFEADDIAQAQHGRAGVHLEHQFGFVRQGGAPAHNGGGKGLRPGAEGGHGKVVQTADEARCDEGFGTGAAAFPANEHLRGGCCLREGIFPVHFLHKVLPERNEEQDAQHAAQQGAQDHLPETHLHAQDIDGRKGEDGTGHHSTAAAANALDNHILRKSLLEAQGARKAHRNDGNGNGRFKYLAHLEAQIRGGSAEQNHH